MGLLSTSLAADTQYWEGRTGHSQVLNETTKGPQDALGSELSLQRSAEPRRPHMQERGQETFARGVGQMAFPVCNVALITGPSQPGHRKETDAQDLESTKEHSSRSWGDCSSGKVFA